MINVIFALGKLMTLISVIFGVGLFIDIPLGIILRDVPAWWIWPSSFVMIVAIGTTGVILAGVAENKLASIQPDDSAERRD